jgi:pimeloyl-ACP methyl ester carboxylesterase
MKKLLLTLSFCGFAILANAAVPPAVDILDIPSKTEVTNIVNALAISSGGNANYDLPKTMFENLYYSSLHRMEYEDAPSFIEQWNDLSSWGSVNVQVLTNALFGPGGLTTEAGANYSYSIGPTESARIVSSINVPAVLNPSNSFAWIGVSSDVAGVAPISGDNNAIAIGVDLSVLSVSNQYAIVWNKGIGVRHVELLEHTAGTYIVNIAVDPSYISLSLVYPGHTNEFSYKIARSAMPTINNIHVWNSDQRGTNGGMSIGYVGVKSGSSTIKPRTLLEGREDFVHLSSDVNGQGIRIWIPKNYDSRYPLPLVVLGHGYGGNENWIWNGQAAELNPERPYFQYLVNAGYIVASSYANGDNWGNQNGVDSIGNLIDYVRKHYAIGPVFLMGASMGATTTLNYINQHKGEIAGWVGLYPVCSLRNMFDNGWSATITSAYNITGGNPYAQATSGYDPLLVSSSRYTGVPIRIYASPSDVTVTWTQNAKALTNKLAGLSKECVLVPCSGVHGDPSHYMTNDVVEFFQRCMSTLTNANRVIAEVAASSLLSNLATTNNNSALTNIIRSIAGTSGNVLTNDQAGIHFNPVSGPSFFYDSGGNIMAMALPLGGYIQINDYDNLDWLVRWHGIGQEIKGARALLVDKVVLTNALTIGYTNPVPLDLTTAKLWFSVTNLNNGQVYKMPLYQ